MKTDLTRVLAISGQSGLYNFVSQSRTGVIVEALVDKKIFDIAPLRYLEYSKDMKYHEVLESQKKLQEAIEATKAAEGDSGNVNSIVKLMALSAPANIPNLDSSNKEVLALDVMRSQMNDMKMMMEMFIHDGKRGISRRSNIAAIEYERIVNRLDKLASSQGRRIRNSTPHLASAPTLYCPIQPPFFLP